MKLRQHRGSLAESLATTVVIEATKPALLVVVKSFLSSYGVDVTEEMLSVTPYGGVDKRTGWDTYIVTVDGYGVYGFTDCPIC